MSRIRTLARLSTDLGAETVEIDVSASLGHGIDPNDQDMVAAALAANHVMLLDLVRAQLRERGVDPDRRTVEILDAHLLADDAPPPRPALTVVEGWTVTEVEVRETTTYTVPVLHPVGASAAEIAAVGYNDYCQALHPDAVFAHTAGPDEVTVAATPHDSGQHDETVWPRWAAQRPDHQPDPEPSPAPGRRPDDPAAEHAP